MQAAAIRRQKGAEAVQERQEMTPARVTTTPEQAALRLVSFDDEAGRNWVAPEPCEVCASIIGGHLPQCPAADRQPPGEA